jgi:hypothetical protein
MLYRLCAGRVTGYGRCMRRVLSLLLVLAVLWCGSHLGESAMAADFHDDAACAVESPLDCDASGEGSPQGAHGLHHHCPLAPADRTATSAMLGASPGAPPCQRPVTRLDSLSQAPPLQPPTA